MTACVRSGWCCRQGVCPYGTWDPVEEQCVHLVGELPGGFSCGIHDEIMAADPDQQTSPAFGAGCSSSMNPHRAVVLRAARTSPQRPAEASEGA